MAGNDLSFPELPAGRLCLAKIESAPLVKHIADVHRLNLEISRSPDVAFELPERAPTV